jgi:hypothetical protein
MPHSREYAAEYPRGSGARSCIMYRPMCSLLQVLRRKRLGTCNHANQHMTWKYRTGSGESLEGHLLDNGNDLTLRDFGVACEGWSQV